MAGVSPPTKVPRPPHGRLLSIADHYTHTAVRLRRYAGVRCQSVKTPVAKPNRPPLLMDRRVVEPRRRCCRYNLKATNRHVLP